ncbi:MAG TPA: hypothetical protein PLD10_06155 [Rhodopila sp.]|nr:hypothetical protein [Rhodopila sp.]
MRHVRHTAADKPLDRIAIFVIYAEVLDANHRRTLTALHGAGYAVALVNNKSFRNPESLPQEAAFVIESHNVGRDIGAYIRAVRSLQASGALLERTRILFLNDSVVYLPGMDAVFATMAAAPEDWIGTTESRQGGHYLNSWCFQLSAAVVRGDAFARWAGRFAFLANRVYLIRAGEIRLTRMLLAAGVRPRVLFGSDFWAGLCDQIARSDHVVARIIPRNLGELYPKREHAERFLHKANQTHLFTFPGVAFGVFPFVKKDLYYRDVFSQEHVELLCAEIATHHGQKIATECRQSLLGRGDGGALSGWAGLRWRLGID